MYPQEKLAKIGKYNKSYIIGIPKENTQQENRISLTPDAVNLLINNDHNVWIENGAGEKAKFTDHDFSDAGAKIVYNTKEVYQADVVLKIEPPGGDPAAVVRA